MAEDDTRMFQGREYVYAVYREKSFSRAAQKLFISQPSLSAAVKRTEERIGYPVFDRSTKPLKLTECGEKYIAAVEKMMAAEQEFFHYINDLGEDRKSHSGRQQSFFFLDTAPDHGQVFQKIPHGEDLSCGGKHFASGGASAERRGGSYDG